MQDSFNDKARKSFLEVSTNISFNLAVTPLFTIMQDDKYKTVGFGSDATYNFNQKHEAGLRQGIEDFNAAGGRYYWLFSNVAINLDVVTAVAVDDKVLTVMYPGGSWVSSACENANDIYQKYLAEARKTGESAEPAPGPGGKPKNLIL